MFKPEPSGRFVGEECDAFIPRNDGGFDYRQEWEWHFEVRNLRATKGLTQREYDETLAFQANTPVCVLDNDRGTRWWVFQGQCYSEDENLSVEELKILILDRLHRKKRLVQRAQARLSATSETNLRETIPDDVKMLVWQRDGGRCVRCGTQERLEFDHIIPVVKGGSSTARNIQILCEPCNREKRDNLT